MPDGKFFLFDGVQSMTLVSVNCSVSFPFNYLYDDRTTYLYDNTDRTDYVPRALTATSFATRFVTRSAYY